MLLFFTYIHKSYAFALQITEDCLPPIVQLPHLEDLVLEGCLGIDDDGLATLKHGCKSIRVHPFLIWKILNYIMMWIDVDWYILFLFVCMR